MRLADRLYGGPPWRSLPDPPLVRSLIARGESSNVAVTDRNAADPARRPRWLAGPPHAAGAAVAQAVLELPRWTVQGRSDQVIWAVRRTRLFRFRDDVLVLLEPAAGGTLIQARSASRIGRNDLGQNARNLAELWDRLGAQPV